MTHYTPWLVSMAVMVACTACTAFDGSKSATAGLEPVPTRQIIMTRPEVSGEIPPPPPQSPVQSLVTGRSVIVKTANIPASSSSAAVKAPVAGYSNAPQAPPSGNQATQPPATAKSTERKPTGPMQAIEVGTRAGLPLALQLPFNPRAAAYRQRFTLSCEVAATKMALFYWNLDPSEEELQARLGTNPNPDLGFRGAYWAPPNGLQNYGAHAPALKRLLEAYPAVGRFRADMLANLDDVRHALVNNEPALLWVTFGLMPSSRVPMTFQGQEVDLVPNEHVVTAYGYDPTGFFVYDPETSNNISGHVSNTILEARMALFQHPALALRPLF